MGTALPDLFDTQPLVHPDRPVLHWRPMQAWRHFRNLMRDKERTEEVFPIFEALPWRGMRRAAEVFFGTEQGRAIRLSEPDLPEILDDHEALRRTPKGSLAHAYCDFMEREGLTAKGLVEEFAKFAAQRKAFDDQLNWYINRLRDTHDLQHVLTGFGRDALGEQCVLAFTYGQQPSPAHLFLGYAGGLEIRKRLKVRAPVLRAVREAQKMGKACPRIAEMPLRALLALPLEQVREQLNIQPPRQYHAVHTIWRANGIDPFDLLTAGA